MNRLIGIIVLVLQSAVAQAEGLIPKTYFPERRPAPRLKVQTILPILARPSVKSCEETLDASSRLGLIYVDHGNTLPSQGRHEPVVFENTYRLGGFGGFGTILTTETDRYVGYYEWRRGATEVPRNQERPESYDQVVYDFMTEWKIQHPEWSDVEKVGELEAVHDWRRSSFIAMSFEDRYFAGARLFDGSPDPVILTESGERVKGVLSDDESSSDLPLEVRFPEVKIEGRKIEIGLMTSTSGIHDGFQTIFFKLARSLVEKYGEGEFNKVETRIPRYIESDQLGTVDIGGGHTISQVYRYGPMDIDFSEPVVYYDFVPDKDKSLEAMDDLYIYLVVNSRMKRFYKRTSPKVEFLQALDGEQPGSLSLMRIKASDFVDQFYFSIGQVEPGLNRKASEIMAYQEADKKNRRELLAQSQKERRWYEIAQNAIEGSYPGGSLQDFDVQINGNWMDPDAALEVIVLPRIGSPAWHEMYDDQLSPEDYF